MVISYFLKVFDLTTDINIRIVKSLLKENSFFKAPRPNKIDYQIRAFRVM